MISKRRADLALDGGPNSDRTFSADERSVHVVCNHDIARSALNDASFIQPGIAEAISAVSYAFHSDLSVLSDFVRHNPISMNGESHRICRRHFLQHYGHTLSSLSPVLPPLAKTCFETFCQSKAPDKIESVTSGYVDAVIEKILAQWEDVPLDHKAWSGSSSCIFEYVHAPGRLRKKAEQVSRVSSRFPAAAQKEILLTYILQGRDPLIGALNRALHNFAQLPAGDRATAVEKMDAKQLFFATSPVNYIGRVATKNRSLCGKTISAGDQLILMLPWANADTTLKTSVAFGSGPHACAGQALALSIAKAWIEALNDCFPRIEWERIKFGSFKPAVFLQYGN
jgi:hypothetical protein